MNKQQITQILIDLPHYVAEFEIINIPKWRSHAFPLNVGDRLYYINGFHPVNWGGGGLSIGNDSVTFIQYIDISPWLKKHNLMISSTLY